MLAMAILVGVIGAVYTIWYGVISAAAAGNKAAAAAQRQRQAMQIVKEAVAGAQLFVANPKYYSFEVGEEGKGELSFVARLSDTFPRSGKFGAAAMRRVLFTLEPGADRNQQLVLRQQPILAEDLDEDEKTHPVVLAEQVRVFTVELWDTTAKDWTDKWIYTNQLPKLVRVSLQLGAAGYSKADASVMMTSIVALPTAGVQPTNQPTRLP
jgi:DNA-binding ferritin-like protein (Dps family)